MVGEGASVRLILIRTFTKLVFSINMVKNYDEKLIHFRLQLFNLKPVTFEGLKSLFLVCLYLFRWNYTVRHLHKYPYLFFKIGKQG